MSKYLNKWVEIDGIKFQSQAEGLKYWELKNDPSILRFELQPKFELQPAFEKDGQKIRAIYYKADFEVWYKDGRHEIIDIKGFQTKEFKLKAKMFDYKYPNLILIIETR